MGIEEDREAAEAKAKELWGEKAFAAIAPGYYLVGELEVEDGEFFQHIYGAGTSWELAFYSAKLNLN